MKLGTFAFITCYTKKPIETMEFHEKLGFQKIASQKSLTLLTDGNLYYDIRTADRSATALSYKVEDVPNAIEMAENLEIEIVEKSIHHVMLREPNGLLILLAGPEVITLKEFPRNPTAFCGTFYEISLETGDVDRSIVWWQNVGFKVTTQKETWCTLDDGRIKIGLYKKGTCTHKFKNPSLTYFESDMARRIAEIKKRGIVFVQEAAEIGIEGHAIAESPDGQYFFLFSIG